MDIRIGPPATGDNFYKRPKLISRLMRALDRGNVAFLGPRRTGKTSCLKEIHSHPGKFLTIFLNLEKLHSPEEWLAEMVAGLRAALEKPPERFAGAKSKTSSFLSRVRTLSIPGVMSVDLGSAVPPREWVGSAREFLALLSESEVPVLFLLDEFPTFLNLVAKRSGISAVEEILLWFRAARSELQESEVRFLVTGSIGLKGVVRKWGLAPTVNEFDTHEIPPLGDDEAHGLMSALADSEGIDLPEPCRGRILELLGANWPILVQLFVSEIQEAGLDGSPTLEDLDRIYREGLVHGSRNQYCDGMFDRVKEIFSPSEARLARALLRALCLRSDGFTRAEMEAIHAEIEPNAEVRAGVVDEFDHVLDTLKHDGYLLQRTESNQSTTFASNILRDYWCRKSI